VNVDRASFALRQEILAKVRADAERELKKQMQALSIKQGAKLRSFLSNIKFLGDVGKAAGKSRVSRALLDKWMNTPGICWAIDTASHEAQLTLHSGDTAESVLWRVKILPQLKKDAEVFKATGQHDRESRVVAKIAAQDLKGSRWEIVQAANNSDKHFFIDLGRCLSGEISTRFYTQLEHDVADICCANRSISARDALCELIKRGHNDVSEEHFRVLRSGLGLAKPATAKRKKSS